MSETNDKEIADKIWVDIPSRSGVWKAVEPGDMVEGTYLKKTQAPYRGRPNWKYCFESDDPLAVDGKISFFGTEGINGALEDELIGKMVRVIYKGEKASADKMKKPFKVFQIQALLASTDPLYKKYTEGVSEDTENSVTNGSAPSLKTNDDPEALNMVEYYKGELKRANKKQTAKNVISLASEDEELTSEHLTRLKKHLADMVKADEIEAE